MMNYEVGDVVLVDFPQSGSEIGDGSQFLVYTIRVQEKVIKILFLVHAIERIKKWGIKEEMVAEALLLPEEVIVGHRNRYIAHKRYDNHVVRAVYEYEGELPILVTVYFPYADRYFEGGGIYEDKIFKGG